MWFPRWDNSIILASATSFPINGVAWTSCGVSSWFISLIYWHCLSSCLTLNSSFWSRLTPCPHNFVRINNCWHLLTTDSPEAEPQFMSPINPSDCWVGFASALLVLTTKECFLCYFSLKHRWTWYGCVPVSFGALCSWCAWGPQSREAGIWRMWLPSQREFLALVLHRRESVRHVLCGVKHHWQLGPPAWKIHRTHSYANLDRLLVISIPQVLHL